MLAKGTKNRSFCIIIIDYGLVFDYLLNYHSSEFSSTNSEGAVGIKGIRATHWKIKYGEISLVQNSYFSSQIEINYISMS